MRKLRIVRADPAGNITLFVLTPVERAECAAVAADLMKIEELKAEQVGFVFPNGHMEMEAGEFCGNASRAYGYLLAKQQGLTGRHTMHLSVSGCDHPIAVTVDMDAGTSEAEMPLPRFVRPVNVDGTAGTLVHLGGITHLVVQGVTPSREFFEKAEPLFEKGAGTGGLRCLLPCGGAHDAAGQGARGGHAGVRGQLRQRYAGQRSRHERGARGNVLRRLGAAGGDGVRLCYETGGRGRGGVHRRSCHAGRSL